MLKLQDVAFPSKNLTCYESVLVTLLKYLGLSEETPLMGTQAYFVLDKTDLSLSPRFNRVDQEWQRIHGLHIETSTVADEAGLNGKLVASLDAGLPVCLAVDIYFLPHTTHHLHLHQHHYLTLFGYDADRYYMVCPYYRFRGWVDAALIHTSFFSPASGQRHLIVIPELKLQTLSPSLVQTLVQESCRYMLGLAVPPALVAAEPHCLGLAGIRTLAERLNKLLAEREGDLPQPALINLSRQVMAVGYSRYWFQRLIQTCQQQLLPPDQAADLDAQFASAIQSWKAIGLRLGMGVHGQRHAKIAHAARQIGRVHDQEEQLFNTLLGALPDYEWGKL